MSVNNTVARILSPVVTEGLSQKFNIVSTMTSTASKAPCSPGGRVTNWAFGMPDASAACASYGTMWSPGLAITSVGTDTLPSRWRTSSCKYVRQSKAAIVGLASDD